MLSDTTEACENANYQILGCRTIIHWELNVISYFFRYSLIDEDSTTLNHIMWFIHYKF